MKVFTIFGTRPEAIKLAPVIKELKRRLTSKRDRVVVCVTAQHRQMLDQVLELFNVVPDYDLNIMENDQTPAQVAAAVLRQLEPILKKEQPDWILVQGDTTTVAATSLCAYYNQVKIGHVEAGLRTRNKWKPFPEEINRQVAGVIADMHFAPTEQARQNLLVEGVPQKRIIVTGNSVIDALQWVARRPFKTDLLNLEGNKAKLILVTAHRRENFGQPLENICLALRDLAARYDNCIRIVYPVHLNPKVWEPVHRLLSGIPNIILTAPLDYQSLVNLMKRAYLVLTDSGGIQEEAPSLGKPVLVLRSVTERPEAVDAGTVKLVGTEKERITAGIMLLLEDQKEYKRMARAVNPYGDGHASARIIKALLGKHIKPFVHSRLMQETAQPRYRSIH